MDATAFEDGTGTSGNPEVRRAALRVLVVDDHRLFADTLCLALYDLAVVEDCRHADGVKEAMRQLEAAAADVVVLDGDLDDPGAVVGAVRIRRRWPGIRILVLAEEPDVDLLAEAATAGVDAFRSKDVGFDELVAAVTSEAIEDLGNSHVLADLTEAIRRREAARGVRNGCPVEMTPREREVLGLLSQGVAMKDMARLLGIRLETCRGYVKSLLMKLDARTQLQAVVIASRMGLLDDQPDTVGA